MVAEKKWFYITCIGVFVLKIIMNMYSFSGKTDANLFWWDIILISFGSTLTLIFASSILGMLAIGAILFVVNLRKNESKKIRISRWKQATYSVIVIFLLMTFFVK